MILITTPNGRVGQEIVKQLQEQNEPFRLGAHTVDKAQTAFPGTEVVPFDYRDEAGISAAFDGIDRVFLATPGGVSTEQVNRAVELAKAAGVRHIVKLSSMSVAHMEGQHRQNEAFIRASGIAWTLLRPNWFMQNYSSASADAVRRGALPEAAENAATSFVDARDIAAVAVAALTQDGHADQIYTLTGPAALTRTQVAEQLSGTLGREVRYAPISADQLVQGMRSAGLPDAAVHHASELYSFVRAGQTAAVTDDVQRVTGRAPISFTQFTKDYAGSWHQSPVG